MKTISKSSLNIYEVIDTALEISRNLPLLLFLVIPYLYDNVNGYSIVLCLPLACLLFFLSSNCWLEIKSRYIVQNEPYLNTKSINRLLENPLENDVEKYSLFRIFDSVIGLNLAVVLSLADSINALAIHCLVLKWFYEIIFSHLFYHQPVDISCSDNNQSTNQTQSDSVVYLPPKTITILIEVFTSIGYFILLKLLSSGDFLAPIRRFIESLSRWEDARLKSINSIIYYTFFYVVTMLIVYLSISASSFKLAIDCEYFFKNLTNQSYLLGVAVLMCTYYTVLIEHFSKIRNKKSKGRPVPTTRSNYLLNELEKYLNIMIKIASLCAMAVVFVFLLTTFNRYRNRCCFGFYESVLQAASNDLAHVTKQICLFIVCLFVFCASNRRLRASFANSIELADRLFGSQSCLAKNSSVETTSMISAESGIDLSGSTRTLIIKSRPTTRSLLRIKLLEKLNLTDSILIIYTLVTLIQLASLTLSNIIELWTASFLLVNLIVITATLLTNYFPYQVLIDEKNQSSQTNVVGFLIAKQKPVVRATPRLILKQHHEPPREANDEASMIDSVFVEHKQHLRSQALSDHSLSFGVDQPSMQSAYRASFGYTAFCIASIFLSIGVRIFHLSSSSSSFKSVLLFIAFSLLFISLGFAAVYFYILKSNRETIYRKNLFYKMLFFPFVQLTIVFFTIFVLLSLSIFAINFFLIEMFVLVIALAVINRIVYFRRLKKLSPKTTANERWENAVGEPLEMNVFTIADTNAYNDSDSDENNDFEVKIDTNKNENIEKAEGLSSKNATKQDVETSSLKKIGSETSNINLLI